MIGFYVVGGGFGHLKRVKTFIENCGNIFSFKVITTNPAVSNFFSKNNTIYIKQSESTTPEKLKIAVKKILDNHRFEAFYLDTFPNGILGELHPEMFQKVSVNLLARRLKWENYSLHIIKNMVFEKCLLFEELETAHYYYLLNNTQRIEHVKLKYSCPNESKLKPISNSYHKPIWLIVHSSNKEEVELLVTHAKDIASIEGQTPHFVVISDVKLFLPNHIELRSEDNPTDWYPVAEKIFTGGGFNTIHELEEYKTKHVCLPFPRRFDDQFWRVKNYESDN